MIKKLFSIFSKKNDNNNKNYYLSNEIIEMITQKGTFDREKYYNFHLSNGLGKDNKVIKAKFNSFRTSNLEKNVKRIEVMFRIDREDPVRVNNIAKYLKIAFEENNSTIQGDFNDHEFQKVYPIKGMFLLDSIEGIH